MSNQSRWSATPSLRDLGVVLIVAANALGDLIGRRTRRNETGNVITDNLAWIVFGVVAIVAIGALLQTLGANVVAWVTKQLGI